MNKHPQIRFLTAIGIGVFFILTLAGCGLIAEVIQIPNQAAATLPIEPTPTQSPARVGPSPEPDLTETLIPPTEPPRVLNPSSTPIPSNTPFNISVRPVVIGTSAAGRPLEVYRFGYGSQGRMIIAGIHGGYEWNTIALAHQLVNYLSNNPQAIPPKIRLFILVAMNPDGEARSHGYGGRANENGVDLNRNFPVGWQADWNKEGCWEFLPITAGASPASEPETQAVMNFVQSNQIEAIISYHSAMLGIFPSGDPPDPQSVSLAEAIARVSNYPYPPIDTGCEIFGSLVDWAGSLGIAAVDVELTNHEDTDFDQSLVILNTFLHWQHK